MSKAGSYYDKVYQDEIESFSFSTRNNDGATFSASVPSQTATLVLNAKGDTLIDDTLEKGCYAAITSDATTPLRIIMMINEITNLKRKGRVEISLGRVTADTFNLTTHGVYTVDSQKVSDFVQEAGLKDYLFTDMDNEYLNNLVVNSKSVDDTIMAMAWSQNVRRNVTLLPAYCTPALSEPYRYNYSGVMLFTNKKKEQLSETNDFTQVYRVAASDIYDYTIEAAQPPVTEVKTAGSGLLGPVGADESTVFQYGEAVGTSGGTSQYLSENATTTPSFSLYMASSKNISTTEKLGTVTIQLQASYYDSEKDEIIIRNVYTILYVHSKQLNILG